MFYGICLMFHTGRIKSLEDIIEEMNKTSSIMELRTCSHPSPTIHSVVMATFLLIGEDSQTIQVEILLSGYLITK